MNKQRKLTDYSNSNIGIVIPIHNAIEHVKNLLKDLERTEANGVPTIFVNDASTEPIKDLILEYCKTHKNCQYLENRKQNLFTRTCNKGLRAHATDIDFFVLLNTDCELSPGWLDRMVKCISENPNTVVCGYPDGEPKEGKDREAFFPSKVGHATYITGHAIMIARIALETIGPLNELNDPEESHIASERKFCEKLNKYGLRMFEINSSLVLHRSGGPSWNRNLGWLFNEFNYKNLWRGRPTL